MPVHSQIAVPSPGEIKAQLFQQGIKTAPSLPEVWRANVLLTPPGGSQVDGSPTDELFAGIITYDSRSSSPILRAQLFGLESLKFYDLLFGTDNGAKLVWPLKSDPSRPNSQPTGFGKPAQPDTVLPAVDAISSQFVHVGTWKSVGKLSHAFSGKKSAKASTWVWQDAETSALRRLMSIETANDFGWAILGSFYFVDFTSFDVLAESDLPNLLEQAPKVQNVPQLTMKTFQQLVTALNGGSLGGGVPCKFADAQHVLPGLLPASAAPSAPRWTNTVTSQCYMIGQDSYPYFCQIWYDWNRGCQITVFVQKDNAGEYGDRFDEFLPKGKTGPAIVYSWTGTEWDAVCSQQNGGVVPMPVPNFVEVAQGKCRAAFLASPYFGDLSIWSVALGDQNHWSDFWYWFDRNEKGVVFSLDPASSLTLIDYQTFEQGVSIDPKIFDDPTPSIPACAANNLMALTTRPRFKPINPKHH